MTLYELLAIIIAGLALILSIGHAIIDFIRNRFRFCGNFEVFNYRWVYSDNDKKRKTDYCLAAITFNWVNYSNILFNLINVWLIIGEKQYKAETDFCQRRIEFSIHSLHEQINPHQSGEWALFFQIPSTDIGKKGFLKIETAARKTDSKIKNGELKVLPIND